jgi:chemotaxis protein CheX
MALNGVRQMPNQNRLKFLPENGECGMTLSRRDSAHLVSDPEKLSLSVLEVFGTMLGVECEPVESCASQPPVGAAESVTAVVGFGGILSGACVITCDDMSARHIASRMTGMAFEALDDVVKDAIGEICNMVAGAWKSRVPDLAANCGLSVPAVITGRDYNLHMQSPEFRVVRVYRFDAANFQVAIVCDELL